MADSLGPAPSPKRVVMPIMTEADKKRLAVSSSSSPPPPQPPMMMTGSPPMMPMMTGGYPAGGIGMGPNLVFNFYQPYGMTACVGGEEKKEEETVEEKPKEKGPYVQGDPTWCQPRQIVKKGQQLEKEPCTIM